MFADLHLHTRHSDGTYTPAELISAARSEGLSIVALTDHDTLDGCAETAALAASQGLEFITGTEVTAEIDGRELHILGYFVDPAHPEFALELARAQEIRQNRVRQMLARLNARSIPLTPESVFALAMCRAPGRPHVARALVQGGFCATVDEAFEKYLKRDRPGWVPKKKISAARALELIHAAGGLAVLAHPGLNHDDRLIERLARLGLDGLECYHPRHNPAAAAKYAAMAQALNLAVTGGSDCHGMSKGQPTIGTVKIPVELVAALRARHQVRQASRRLPATARAEPVGSSADS